jgi:hypothetical protein
VAIHVFSVFGENFSVGSTTIQANQQQFVTDLDNSIDLDKAIIRQSTTTQYDRVVVQGAKVKSCFTIAFADGTLEAGWTAAEETAYAAGDTSDPTDEKKNDAERKTDKYERVYQTFRIPNDWGWVSGNGLGGDLGNASPTVDWLGYVDEDTVKTNWSFGKRLLRYLPFEKDAAIGDAEPEFLPPLVVVVDPDTGNYHQVEKLDSVNKNPASVRMLDRELGFQISPSINHIFGLGHFDPDVDAVSGTAPQVNYSTLIATVFAETDERLKVQVDLPSAYSSENLKTLVVNVPDAELWYVAPNTVKEVTNGQLVYYSGTSTIRNDRERLEAIAALASSWYSQKRSVVSITIQNIAHYFPVGGYLVAATTSWQREQIGTVITQASWDFRRGTSTVETGHFEIDVSVFLDIPNMSDFRAVSREFHEQKQLIDELKRDVGNIPSRQIAGAVGTNVFPGRVLSKDTSEGNDQMTYLVDLYANGPDADSTGQVLVRQLQIDTEEVIPAGTWVFVMLINGNYYMQVPVWVE